MKNLFLFLVAALLAGCSTGWINPSKMSKLDIGMTKREVIKILGTPNSAEGQKGSERLWYVEDQGGWIHIYHFVQLTDGKVESYGHGKMGDEANKLMQPNVPTSAHSSPVVVPVITK